MDEDFSSHADVDPSAFAGQERLLTKTAGKGFNPGLIVLLVVVGVLLIFIVGNYVLYMYAQKIKLCFQKSYGCWFWQDQKINYNHR